MSLLLKGILFGTLAQILTFLQFQGGIKYGIYKNHPWLLALGGIPISYLFMLSVSNFVQAYSGEIWPSRLIGFGIGVIVFTFMSYWMFSEPITTKTTVCLLLSIAIILVQVFWK
jgi:multidrug transporter EmrE-like cation transporter